MRCLTIFFAVREMVVVVVVVVGGVEALFVVAILSARYLTLQNYEATVSCRCCTRGFQS